MSSTLTISEAARQLSVMTGQVVSPRTLTNLFYTRILPDEMGPIRVGRRMIPEDQLENIRMILARRGIVPSQPAITARTVTR